MGVEEWDASQIGEEEWEEKAVYLVPDTPVEAGVENHATLSLPRNLVLKPSQTLSDVSLWRFEDMIYNYKLNSFLVLVCS